MRPLGLRAQIVAALAVLVGLATALTGFTVASLAEKAVYRSTLDAGETAAGALAAVLGSGVGAGRPVPELEDVAVRALGRAGIDEVVLFDADRQTLFHVHLPGRGHALEGIHPRGLRPRSERVGGNIRIFAPDDSGAAVAVNVSLSDATARLASLERLILGYAGISALILLLFGLYAMTRLVVRPLEKVREAAERVATGELGVEVPAEGGREIVELGRAFNRMTANLRAHQSRLQEKVREVETRTEELAKTQGHLVRSEKLASVGRLAAGLAHEVGNPVSAILGFCDLIETGATPEETKDYATRMKKEAERVDRIIRDLLSYARPATTPDDSCDVAKVIEDATGLLWPQKGFREVEIERVVAEGMPRATIASEPLGQVLVNLLLNAADAMQGKGQVRLEASAEGSSVKITVTDSGPGIEPARLGQIFDPFFTTKAPGKGTGLGLAICLSIVETAGGRIEASNVPQGGARFTILLRAGSRARS